MAVLTREQLRSQIRENKISPVYLFFGAETYLRDLAIKTIADKIFSEGDLREFNETEISLANSDVRDALAAAQQLPMMSKKRLVRVTGVRISDSGRKDNIKDSLSEDDEHALSTYLEDPCPDSVVFFIADILDKRRKVSKLLLEKTTAVEFTAMNDQEIVGWLKE